MEISGSGALVVGGASGLGEATVRRLHADGAAVTIADIDADKGAALASELGLEFVAVDVRQEDQVEAAVGQAAEADGGLRIAVCCAGIGWAQRIAGSRGPHPLEQFQIVVEINLVGTFNVMRFAAVAMIANEADTGGERGVLVNTASAAAFDGQIGQVAYSASKAGIVGMTLPVARDLARHGIRCVTIAPGLFDTQLLAALPEENRLKLAQLVPFPPRLGRPPEFASLVAEIVDNTMLNGETIRLDGALRMPPQ